MARTIAAVLGLAGLGLIAAGIALVVHQRRFAQRAVHVPGTVVDMQAVASSGDSDIGLTYRPVVRYPDRYGRPVEFTSNVGYSPARHRRGDTVRVLYDPDQPDKPRVAGAGTIAIPAILFAFGIGCGAIAMLVLVVHVPTPGRN